MANSCPIVSPHCCGFADLVTRPQPTFRTPLMCWPIHGRMCSYMTWNPGWCGRKCGIHLSVMGCPRQTTCTTCRGTNSSTVAAIPTAFLIYTLLFKMTDRGHSIPLDVLLSVHQQHIITTTSKPITSKQICVRPACMRQCMCSSHSFRSR